MCYSNLYQLLLYPQKDDTQGILTVNTYLLLLRKQTLLVINTYLSR